MPQHQALRDAARRHEMRYIPLSQQDYCCVPACMQMVLLRRGLPLLSQEEIGHHLGLTVPIADHWKLPGARASDTPPTRAGYGTQVGNDEYSISRFFVAIGCPLRERYVTVDEMAADGAAWLAGCIAADHDVLGCFNYRALYGSGESFGHVSLLDSVEGGNVVLVDPAPHQPKRREVALTTLLASMRLHGTGGNRGGWWVVEAA